MGWAEEEKGRRGREGKSWLRKEGRRKFAFFNKLFSFFAQQDSPGKKR